MARKKIDNLSFEETLNELEQIVEAMEKGDLNLEDSMAMFERGLSLSQASQEKLQNAEQKIQILMQDKQNLAPFSADENNDA